MHLFIFERQLLLSLLDLVPQQWIGSSVALALEVGVAEAEPRVAVKVFDWGRAELTTEQEFQELSAEEKESRKHYWRLGACFRCLK